MLRGVRLLPRIRSHRQTARVHRQNRKAISAHPLTHRLSADGALGESRPISRLAQVCTATTTPASPKNQSVSEPSDTSSAVYSQRKRRTQYPSDEPSNVAPLVSYKDLRSAANKIRSSSLTSVSSLEGSESSWRSFKESSHRCYHQKGLA